MLAHTTSQIANKAKLGESLGISSPTVQHYMEILEKTFMIRILYPYHSNLKKRLVKSPKYFIRDTGILHSLLEINSMNSLMGHFNYGQSWESYAIEQIISCLPGWHPYFYRTSDGSEIDLLLGYGQIKIAIEFKTSTSPKVGAGFFHCIEALKVDRTYIVCPFLKKEKYPYNKTASVASLEIVISECRNEYSSYS